MLPVNTNADSFHIAYNSSLSLFSQLSKEANLLSEVSCTAYSLTYNGLSWVTHTE